MIKPDKPEYRKSLRSEIKCYSKNVVKTNFSAKLEDKWTGTYFIHILLTVNIQVKFTGILKLYYEK